MGQVLHSEKFVPKVGPIIFPVYRLPGKLILNTHHAGDIRVCTKRQWGIACLKAELLLFITYIHNVIDFHDSLSKT